MAIPPSGPISLDDIQTEFGGTNPINLSEYYSAATGIPASGEISISDFYGTSSRVPIVINNTATTLKADIYALASANPTYSAGITDVVYNNSGTLYSDAPTSASLRTGTFASGDTVKIVNTGLIIGKGGNAGNGAPASTNYPTHSTTGVGVAGGRALSLQFPVTIDNTGGTIAGGGGGGAGGFSTAWNIPGTPPKNPPVIRRAGGSGGGGGAGTNVGLGGAAGAGPNYTGIAGSDGTPTAGGAGGAASPFIPAPLKPQAAGGNGGGRGQTGSSTSTLPGNFTAAGGAAGQAVISNGNPITWIDMGTINGPTT